MKSSRKIFRLSLAFAQLACSDPRVGLPAGQIVNSLEDLEQAASGAAPPVPSAHCSDSGLPVRSYRTRQVIAPALTAGEVGDLLGSSGAIAVTTAEADERRTVIATMSTREAVVGRRFRGGSVDTIAIIKDTVPVVKISHRPSFGTVVAAEGRHQLLQLERFTATNFAPEAPVVFSDFDMGDSYVVGTTAPVGIERERADSAAAHPVAWTWNRGDSTWVPILPPNDSIGWRGRLGLPGPNMTRVRVLRNGGFAVLFVATGIVDLYSQTGEHLRVLASCTAPAYRTALAAQFEAGRRGLRQQRWDYAAADIVEEADGTIAILSLFRGTGINGQLTAYNEIGVVGGDALKRANVRLPLNARFAGHSDRLIAIGPSGSILDIEILP